MCDCARQCPGAAMTGTANRDDTPVIALKPASESLSEAIQARFDVGHLEGVAFLDCRLGLS